MTSLLNSATPAGQDKDLKQWYQEYAAIQANGLYNNDPLIKVVSSDKLDVGLVESRVLETIPKLPVTRGFCMKCQDLFDNWPTLGGSSSREYDSMPDEHEEGWECCVAKSYSTYELEAAARSGCRFCSFLLQSLKDAKLLETFRKLEARISRLEEDSACSLSVQNWGTNPHQLLWLNLPGKVCDSCNAGIATELKLDSCFLPASADCYDEPLDVLDIANNWFSTCSDSHELCKSSEGLLPSRLISIAGDHPRLILTAECTKRPRYATLSHSWGSHDVIKLLSKNLDSFLAALPVGRLPPTFTQAIEITRKLGLDYLWIDSLCIFQDSEADWQRESALMGSIYGGAAICIAASSARDSTQGCFLKPPYFNGGLRARITDGGRKRVQDFRHEDLYNLSTFGTHLGSRAWALQEKMLPPRTIHFGDRGAFWECKTTIASEYLPDGFPSMLVSPLVKGVDKYEYMWSSIVQLYSAANLTFGKDKLPALSGVAKLVHEKTGDQYLAGLWKSQIEEQLCWLRWPGEPALKRPTWRAPTWSWASMDSKVLWHSPQEGVLDTNYARVLDANTTPYADDPFGQITKGVVRLACSSIIAGRLIRSTTAANEEFDVLLSLKEGEEVFPIRIDCISEGEEEDGKPVYLLPILGGKTGTSTGTDGEDMVNEWLIQGIVLRPTNTIRGEFSRIASFRFFKNHAIWEGTGKVADTSYDPFLRVMEEQGASTAQEAFAEVILNSGHPAERYVITII